MLMLLLCLAARLQGEPIPFEFRLPPGYSPFAPAAELPGYWIAARPAGDAQFLISHQLAEAPGAVAARIVQSRRSQVWQPQLQGLAYEMREWSGTWAGSPAAGLDIHFVRDEQRRMILERVLVAGEHLLVGVWEGAEEEEAPARAALDSFVPAPEWLPPPSTGVDEEHGLGATALWRSFPGSLDILFDASAAERQRFTVEVSYQPERSAPHAAGADGELEWLLPGGEARPSRAGAGGVYTLRYELEIGNDPLLARRYGFVAYQDCLAAVEQAWAWLALPRLAELAADSRTTLAPPAWRLRVRARSHETVLSFAPPSSEIFSKADNSRLVEFPPMPAGRSWPFFLTGQFRGQTVAGRQVWLRSGAKAAFPEDAVRFLDRMSSRLQDWLPAAGSDWQLTTFPGCGDRSLAGLLILDEHKDWLQKPLDARVSGRTLRTGLAELAASRAFTVQLQGRGSAAPFLSASLAEYGAWRLLLADERRSEAAELEQSWRRHDADCGELATPLSLIPVEDLAGAQRLLSRGALVWQAIERRAGRAALDQVLDGFLERGLPWTSEELRAALEERAGATDWLEFFRRHVYGRIPPEQG